MNFFKLLTESFDDKFLYFISLLEYSSQKDFNGNRDTVFIFCDWLEESGGSFYHEAAILIRCIVTDTRIVQQLIAPSSEEETTISRLRTILARLQEERYPRMDFDNNRSFVRIEISGSGHKLVYYRYKSTAIARLNKRKEVMLYDTQGSELKDVTAGQRQLIIDAIISRFLRAYFWGVIRKRSRRALAQLPRQVGTDCPVCSSHLILSRHGRWYCPNQYNQENPCSFQGYRNS